MTPLRSCNHFVVAATAALSLLSACETDETSEGDEAPLEVTGTYDDNWGGFLRVTDAGLSFGWYGPDFVAITAYDNDDNWLVGQNTDADEWNPGKWSRVDWAVVDGDLLWCQTVFDAETEEAAATAAAPDATERDTGCAGFAWTVLTPGQGPVAIAGSWTDPFDGHHTIGNDLWDMEFAVFEIASYDNGDEMLIAQNGADNEFSAGLWSRFDWTVDADGGVWFCQTSYDSESAEAAEAVERADATEPATGGCNGFGWSGLAPAATE